MNCPQLNCHCEMYSLLQSPWYRATKINNKSWEFVPVCGRQIWTVAVSSIIFIGLLFTYQHLFLICFFIISTFVTFCIRPSHWFTNILLSTNTIHSFVQNLTPVKTNPGPQNPNSQNDLLNTLTLRRQSPIVNHATRPHSYRGQVLQMCRSHGPRVRGWTGPNA